MRIALLSRSFAAGASDGIARQRRVLAAALAARGHDVHVFSVAEGRAPERIPGVTLHSAPRPRYPNPWFDDLPVLDAPLTDGQVLYELVARAAAIRPFDVIDTPLWMAQGAATLARCETPVVLWLQTTLAHLLELQGRGPRAHEQALLALDRYVLDQSALVLGDSRAIVDDVSRLYGVSRPAPAVAVAWPGIDDHGPWRDPDAEERRGSRVEALVVGRLEQRKGTRELFDHLPALLRRAPRLHVTFIGADNSASDGFKREHGASYPEAFARRHPDLQERVAFAGQVTDDELGHAYRRADLLLHPAHYESFGMVFVEAMRAGLPTVAFAHAGALEIHDATTARLVPRGDWPAVIDAVADLCANAALRQSTGAAARARFGRAFTADAMAERTLDAYARVARAARPIRTRPTARPRLFQATEALQAPDAIGHIIRTHARLLQPAGGVGAIQTIFVQEDLARETGRIGSTCLSAADVLMLHFYGYTRLAALLDRTPARVVIHYHNITPPRFFAPHSPGYEMTMRGRAQLPRVARRADVVTGDSLFNVREFAAHLPQPRPTLCLYPLVDAEQLTAAPCDSEWLASRRAQKEAAGELVILFTGRLAPNKRQDRVVRCAAHLARCGDRPVRVILAGAGDAGVRRAIEREARATSHLAVEIVGTVSDARLRACYRLADVYLSASEHEGFGLPLAEAMAFGVPVVAAEATAVAETLGDSGVLLPAWSEAAAAEAVSRLMHDATWRTAVVERQHRNLHRFSEAALRARLETLAAFLLHGHWGDGMAMSDTIGTTPS